MKKTLILILILITLIIPLVLTLFTPPSSGNYSLDYENILSSGNYPFDYENVLWISENPHIEYWTGSSKKNGIFYTGIENKEIDFGFLPRHVEVNSYEYINNVNTDNQSHNLFSGGYKMSIKGDKFTITVSNSNIETIKVGDKITFKRVDTADTIPEWVNEFTSQNVETTTTTIITSTSD
jgi:plastocyanin